MPSWQRLRELDLEDTDIDDADLADLPDLPALEWLDLSNNAIDGSGFASLDKLTNLRTLRVNDALDDEALRRLPTLTNLRELIVEDNPRLTGASFDELLRFPAIEEIWARGGGITSLRGLAHSKTLRMLVISSTRIGPGSLDDIPSMIALEELYIGGTDIGDDDLRALVKSPVLRRVFLVGARRISIAGVLALLELPTLKDLAVDGTPLTDADREAIYAIRPDIKLCHGTLVSCQ